jgi:hypothetical protein
MHVFGFLGSLMFFVGFVATLILAIGKLMGKLWITSSPFFYLALTMMILGTQLFLAGFVADLVSRSSSNRNDYQVETTVGLNEK